MFPMVVDSLPGLPRAFCSQDKMIENSSNFGAQGVICPSKVILNSYFCNLNFIGPQIPT